MEQADLDWHVVKMELEKDADYIALLQDYNEKMDSMQKEEE